MRITVGRAYVSIVPTYHRETMVVDVDGHEEASPVQTLFEFMWLGRRRGHWFHVGRNLNTGQVFANRRSGRVTVRKGHE
jgi:hypothetical protein